MTTTSVPYDAVSVLMATTGLNFLAGNAVVALTDHTYVPSRTGHSTLADITNELADVSYARVLMTGKSQVMSANTLTLKADDTTFPALVAASVRFVIFAMAGASDALSPLIGYWDLGANQAANVNDFKVIYHLAGFMTIAL